jgi:hypothetical protein
VGSGDFLSLVELLLRLGELGGSSGGGAAYADCFRRFAPPLAPAAAAQAFVLWLVLAIADIFLLSTNRIVITNYPQRTRRNVPRTTL